MIDVLYGMVEDAFSMPLGKDKCVVDREKVLDILDEIRVNLPGEIKAARGVIEKRNEFLEEGKRDAESIRQQAQEEAARLVDENEIVLKARAKASDIVNAAEQRAQDVRSAAAEYCNSILTDTESACSNLLGEVHQVRDRFNAAMNGIN